MIRINLLPAEKRKAEKTPLPRLTLIMLTAAAATGLVFWVLVLLLKIKSTGDEITDFSNQLNSKQMKDDLAKFDTLTKEKGRLTAKLNEIRDLSKRQVEDGWWRAINALWDVINSYPRVWIDDIRALDERAVQGEVKRADADDKLAPPYGVTMRCHVAGDEVVEMTRFRNALKDNPILKETLTYINMNVDWKVDDEKEYNSSSISFNVSMWGAMTKPKKKGAVPPGKGPATAGAPAAPAGGVK